MASNDKDYMYSGSLADRVTKYITQGGRPEYQTATEHPKTLAVYNEPLAKQNGASLGTFEFYANDDGTFTKGVEDINISDPYAKLGAQIDRAVAIQAPKVKISNGRVVVQAPKDVLSSPVVSQIKEELQSLKGSDLNSPEVQKAIESLNEEISTSISDSMLRSSTGWTKDQYNDYQYARQSVSGTNPMSSSNKIKGKDKNGNIIMKTPQEWIDYYREAYNTDERTDAFSNSYRSNDPYERTMALVMGQGGKNPVYGFDDWERASQGWKAFVNQMGKFPEGTFRAIFTGGNTGMIEDLQEQLKIPTKNLREFTITNEEQFNAKKDSIKDKTWSELSDSDKAFLLILGVSKFDQADGMESKAYRMKDLASMGAKNESVSKEAINDILVNNSFDKYREVRNDYDSWQGYDDWSDEGERELQKTAGWSGSAQTIGNIAGVVGRFLWENAVVQGLTGGIAGGAGFSMNAVSDRIGEGIVNKLVSVGVSPASRFGQNAMRFTANLIGTVPEDILQTAVDNVLTYNADENKNLLNPEQMSENFRNNLVFMAIFNAGRAGFNAVRRARIAKQMSKIADLQEAINIDGIASDADDLTRALKKGDQLNIVDDTVSVIDDAGNEKVLDNITPEQANMAKASMSGELDTQKVEIDDAARAVDNELSPRAEAEIDGSTKISDTEPTVKVEVDTPDGRVQLDTPNYVAKNLPDALRMKIESTPAGVRNWHTNTLRVVMDGLRTNLDNMRNKFGDVRVSDFDFVWWNTKRGLQPNEIVGMINPTTGREITQNMIDAMEWWGEQPFTKELRLASRNALGLDGDFNVLGYLPHTVYDPASLSFDEALTGRLWETSTGASVMDDVGNYKGFGGDFNSRYRTFASNMLWDARSTDVAAAKLMEEAQMDGKPITSEQAVRAVEGQKNIQRKIADAGSTKELENALSSDNDDIDFNKIDEATKKQGENSGLGKAIHDNYDEVYYGANSATVSKQSKGVRQSLDTLGNTMKNTVLIDSRGRKMSLYDWGGADLVYAPQNAIEMVNRYMREGGDFRQMLIEFVENHSHRNTEYAEYVADRWMKKIGETPGRLTRGDVIRSLSSSMKWEAMGRLRKWLVMAKYDELNDATKKTIDRFLFNHMQMDTIKTSQKISNKMSKVLNGLTTLRYDALFYGNLKNALLQTSELNRYFTSFKWGDVATMAKRLATDETFRTRVNDYVESIAPQSGSFKNELYGSYSDIADTMKVGQDGVTFRGAGKKVKDAADAIGLAPIEAAENFKNRMMVAGLVQEADRLGLSGDEALRHIRNRFERVALAMNEMGRIGMASNPLARTMLFLQNFQIRELGMHLYNISDELAKGKTVPKKVYNASKYLTKVLGSKLATTLIMARLGYSASQTLGLDPFGILENYTGMDEEDMEWPDYLMKSPLFAGGMTSLISDMYFMARKAYEESNPKTVSEEAEESLTGESSWGLSPSFDQLMGFGQSFIPGSTFFNRIGQMNQMMDSGWATSASGNKMYTAPDDFLNTILGYAFGRSATQNAQDYRQTYGKDIGQTLERIWRGATGQGTTFDPIDTKNYSDWFKGDANDLQQFNKGLRYFRSERDRIIDTYEDAIRRGYSSEEDAEAKNNMNQRLDELYTQLERFVDAYENKNGTIDSNMTKQIVNVLNTGRKVLGDTAAEAESRSLQSYNDALARYSQQGFSPVGTYTGPSESNPEKEVKYQGSPQYRIAVSGKYTLNSEAVAVLKEADRVLADVRKGLKQAVSDAYDAKDYDKLERIQKQYLESFDKTVAPIIATYGSGVLSSTDVVNQLKDMLSTGTVSRSGDLIPSNQYRKDKYGRYRSMPLETVDVKKWAQQRYSNDIYKQPTVRSYSSASDDIMEVRRLVSQGKSDRARARALQLKVRVDNQKRSLSSEDYNWLLNFLNNGGQ